MAASGAGPAPTAVAAATTAAATAAATAALSAVMSVSDTVGIHKAAGSAAEEIPKSTAATATPQPTPPLTRAAKKRKMTSPLQQLDGVADDVNQDGVNSDSEDNSSSAAAPPPPPQLSYAEVAAVGSHGLPELRLPVPYCGICDRCRAPPPTYRTNYGYFCEQCLKKHFFFNKQTDVIIIFD